MHIHFVCTGNTFRSRMAEALLRSKPANQTGIKVTSSGIEAKANLNGPLVSYAQHILKRNRLLPYTSHTWTQTDASVLDEADVIVFMEPEHAEYCHRHYQYSPKKEIVWAVPDTTPTPPDLERAQPYECFVEKLKESEQIFRKIDTNIDHLLTELDTMSVIKHGGSMAADNSKTSKTGTTDTFEVRGEELIKKVKDLINEGNVRRITIMDKEGNTVLSVPMTVGVVGALIAPALAAIGAVAALITECTIKVERK